MVDVEKVWLDGSMSRLTIHVDVGAEDSTAAASHHGPMEATARRLPAAAARVGVVYDAVMELHIREGHPEHPNRVRELNRRLEADGLLSRCIKLTPKLASDEELLLCHSREHMNRVDQLYQNPVTPQGEPAEKIGDTYIITGDIYCNQHTRTAARSAAGCAAQAVRAVLSGEVDRAFAVVRPPGHHAESSELQGFCFYNNVAVAAHAALQHPGMDRVLVFDWDIHHGNGTQEIFYGDKRVLFVSIHRRDGDYYPEGCGFVTEVGVGDGTGYSVNVPWASKGMADADYLAAYDLILDPIISQFDPQLVLISAGFDAAHEDYLGQCHVSPAGFVAMTQRLQRYAGGKVVAVLEGGYVPWLVGDCASAVLQTLLGETPSALSNEKSFKLHRTTKQVLLAVDSIQRQHWSQLAALPPITDRYVEYAASLRMQALSLNRTPSPTQPSLAEAAEARMRTRSANRPGVAATPAGASPAAVLAPENERTNGRNPARRKKQVAGPAVAVAAAAEAPAAIVAAAAADLAAMLNGLSVTEQAVPATAAVEAAAMTAPVAAAAAQLDAYLQQPVGGPGADVPAVAAPVKRKIRIKKTGGQQLAEAAAVPAASQTGTAEVASTSAAPQAVTAETVPISAGPPAATAELDAAVDHNATAAPAAAVGSPTIKPGPVSASPAASAAPMAVSASIHNHLISNGALQPDANCAESSAVANNPQAAAQTATAVPAAGELSLSSATCAISPAVVQSDITARTPSPGKRQQQQRTPAAARAVGAPDSPAHNTRSAVKQAANALPTPADQEAAAHVGPVAEQQPVITGQEPLTTEQHAGPAEQQPAITKQQPARSEPQPVSAEHQPVSTEQQQVTAATTVAATGATEPAQVVPPAAGTSAESSPPKASGLGQWLKATLRLVRSDPAQQQQQQEPQQQQQEEELMSAAAMELPDDD